MHRSKSESDSQQACPSHSIAPLSHIHHIPSHPIMPHRASSCPVVLCRTASALGASGTSRGRAGGRCTVAIVIAACPIAACAALTSAIGAANTLAFAVIGAYASISNRTTCSRSRYLKEEEMVMAEVVEVDKCNKYGCRHGNAILQNAILQNAILQNAILQMPRQGQFSGLCAPVRKNTQ